jgi:uncharacterized protein YcbX
LPRLVFLLNTEAADVGIPLSYLIDLEYGARQETFRRRVQASGLVTLPFAHPAELGWIVERSLRELAAARRRQVSLVIHYRPPNELVTWPKGAQPP